MLDPELDLEADLGIDTVKQAEVFAAIRERYGIARDDTLEAPRLPDTARPSPASSRASVRPGRSPPRPCNLSLDRPSRHADGVMDVILEVVAAQTGYPVDMLDPELDLEADLGIDTVKQAEVFAAIRERYGIARDDTLKLRDYPTLRAVAGFVRRARDQGRGGSVRPGGRGAASPPRASSRGACRWPSCGRPRSASRPRAWRSARAAG